jgi:hypothetical protein
MMIMTPEICQQMRPDLRRYSLIFHEPTLRPPVLDEMMPDIERLIASVAQRFSDQTTPHLHFDEMVGEGRLKLAELLDKGHLDKQPNRAAFFKFFKASINNQARSRVQKYRFTEKRTGVKPPPREERFAVHKPEEHDEDDHAHVQEQHQKSVELSLDDPDLNLQVPDEGCSPHETMREVVDDYEVLLTEIEKLVFRQLIQANDLAWCYAMVDSSFHKKPGKISVKIKHQHLAQGLGMSPELFEEAVLSIRAKINDYRRMSEEQREDKSRYNAVLAQLKEIFGLQIPPSADDMLVRRLLTLAARDQYTKVNEQVGELLEEVGAKIPKSHGDTLSCYGVLYQKNHRICNACGLRHSCATEASNVGLTKIMVSPKLLGARSIRVPAVLPMMEGETMTALGDNTDDAEVLSYLEETFRRTVWKGEVWFSPLESEPKDRQFIFCLGEHAVPLKLRFCNPSDELKKSLVDGGKGGWYAPENNGVREVILLIEQHAKDCI